MKILHTSDWHLGHSLYNFDRTEEFGAMIDQIADIVRVRRPDLFLLSGDVFHVPNPSSAVQRMLTDAILRIHEILPEMTIVITAGNHDSGARHEIFSGPWRALNVFAIGNVSKETPDKHIVEIPGKGYVIAVPYCSERNLPDGFFSDMLNEVERRNSDNLPVVMSAHTTVKGCDYAGHDRASEFMVGGIDALDLDQMGEGYDYLALGHIHHEQFIHSGKHNVRYSGTPLAVSFDEAYPHSVSLVTIESHGDTPQVEKLEIRNPRPLVTLPPEGAASWSEAQKLLADFPDDIPAYIRLVVETDDFLPSDANEVARALADTKSCRFCLIRTVRKTMAAEAKQTMTVEEFRSESPLDMARRYAADTGVDFDEDMTAMFREIESRVNERQREGSEREIRRAER